MYMYSVSFNHSPSTNSDCSRDLLNHFGLVTSCDLIEIGNGAKLLPDPVPIMS